MNSRNRYLDTDHLKGHLRQKTASNTATTGGFQILQVGTEGRGDEVPTAGFGRERRPLSSRTAS